MSSRNLFLSAAVGLVLFGATGCRKKVAAVNTPPAPAAEVPVAQAVEPESAPEPAPAPAPVRAVTPEPAPAKSVTTFAEELSRLLRDAYFDYDQFTIRQDAREVLHSNGKHLIELFGRFPSEVALIEGHADERGSAEYNLGLADRRAAAVKEFLTLLGMPQDRLKTVGYGKERPQCFEQNEGCWQRNRRAHFRSDGQ